MKRFGLSNTNPHSIIASALGVLLVLLLGCATRTAQHEIDTRKEHAIAMLKASELIRLDRVERNSKCRGGDATFAKLTRLPMPDAQLQPLLDYITHAYMLQKYMNDKKVTAEAALTVMGDLVLPPALPAEIDPFNGCIFDLGRPLDRPATYSGGKPADGFVFYWQSRDWRATNQAAIKIFEKFLPSKNRNPFDHFVFEYAMTLSTTLMERQEKGDITLLQSLRAGNAGVEYLIGQAKRHDAQLRENLISAKAQDDALLTRVAVGLGAVATAALVISTIDANYRIANAQTSMANTMRLQALQAPVPIQCNYTLPGRYGTQGYIYCR
jgi:hypothetical protein